MPQTALQSLQPVRPAKTRKELGTGPPGIPQGIHEQENLRPLLANIQPAFAEIQLELPPSVVRPHPRPPGVGEYTVRARLFSEPLRARQNSASDLPKTNPVTRALAPPSHDDLVAIFQKGSGGPILQCNGFGAVQGSFQQAAFGSLDGADDRSGSKEVTHYHTTTTAGVMGYRLSATPVHGGEIGSGNNGRIGGP